MIETYTKYSLLWFIENEKNPVWDSCVNMGTWDEYLGHVSDKGASIYLARMSDFDGAVLAQLILMSERQFPYERYWNA